MRHASGTVAAGGEERAFTVSNVKAAVEEVLQWLPNAGMPVEAAHADPTSRGHIIVAEDNADMRSYICRLLTEAGFTVNAYPDGNAALTACLANRPELVLSDVMMPGLDGFGLLKRLRAEALTATLPVILLSARAGEESRIDGLSTGADDYLIKPFHAHELVARVDGTIRLARARREVEAELRKAKEDAENATKLKDKFLSLVSHDLKGPLGAVRGFLMLMRDDLALREQQEMVKFIDMSVESSDRMIKMISELLSVSRFKTGKIVPRLKPLSVRKLAETELKLLAPLAAGKNVQLLNEIPEGLELCADPDLLAEVIQNLISNAIKFSKKGGTVRVMNSGQGVITVGDDGMGISPERREKLFRYEELTSTFGTAGEPGTGLGLPLSYDLVKAHGGELSVESTLGKGSKFSVRLPVDACPDGVCEGSKETCRLRGRASEN